MGIIRGVTYKKNVLKRLVGSLQKTVSAAQLTVCVVIRLTNDVIEVLLDSIVGDHAVKYALLRAGENRLTDARSVAVVQDLCRAALQLALVKPPLVPIAEVKSQARKLLFAEIKARFPVEVDNRKVEYFSVSRKCKQRLISFRQQVVDQIHAQIDVVEQRTIPVPDDMLVSVVRHHHPNLPLSPGQDRNR